MRHLSREVLLLGAIVVLGTLLRLYLVGASGWRIDYDEAMVALLARQAGSYEGFIPAQHTLGSLEPYALAPLYALFGANVYSFRLYGLLVAALYILSSACLGRAAFGWRAGLAAGLLAAIAPPYLLITSLKTWGSTIETLILGNLLLLAVHGALQSPQAAGQRRFLLLAGFCAGLMFWLLWLGFAYYLVVALLLLWQGRGLLWRYGGLAALAFLLGSLPFWVYNLRQDFASFRALGAGEALSLGELLRVAGHFLRDLLPRLATGDPAWNTQPAAYRWLLVLLYGLGLGLFLLRTAKELWRWGQGSTFRPPPLRLMLALLPACILGLYLFSPNARNALNPWGIDATGRYVVTLYSVLPAALAGALFPADGGQAPPWRTWLAGAFLALLLSLNLFNALTLNPVRAFDSPYYDRLPRDLAPLIDYLRAGDYRYVWTDVGIAQPLMFQAGGDIQAADYYDAYLAGGQRRFPAVLQRVQAADLAVFVVPTQAGQQDFPLRRAFDAADLPYRLDWLSPTLVVIVPQQHVDPARVAAGLGYQY